jgi:hypothetical protein
MLCLCLMVKLNLTNSVLGHYVGFEVHDPKIQKMRRKELFLKRKFNKIVFLIVVTIIKSLNENVLPKFNDFTISSFSSSFMSSLILSNFSKIFELLL